MTGTKAPTPAAARGSAAFTLTELLVVIVLIVLILAMAVPAFNLISGSGSVDQAQNQMSAMFAQAQATAIDRENYVGVLFYKDRESDRTALSLVEKVKPKPWVYEMPAADGTKTQMRYRTGDVVSRVTTLTGEPAGMPGEPLGTFTRYYIANRDHPASLGNGPTGAGGTAQDWTLTKPYIIDLVRDGGEFAGEAPTFRERQLLPKNVAVQFPFEPPNWATGQKYYRGQRVFDVQTNQLYACRTEHISNSIATGAGANRPGNGTYWVTDPSVERYVQLGLVMFGPDGRPVADTRGGFSIQIGSALDAQLGMTPPNSMYPFMFARTDFVTFDQEAFRGAGHNDEEPMLDNAAQGSPAAETAEEDWLDKNGTLLIVHKYRGTLGRAE